MLLCVVILEPDNPGLLACHPGSWGNAAELGDGNAPKGKHALETHTLSDSNPWPPHSVRELTPRFPNAGQSCLACQPPARRNASLVLLHSKLCLWGSKDD